MKKSCSRLVFSLNLCKIEHNFVVECKTWEKQIESIYNKMQTLYNTEKCNRNCNNNENWKQKMLFARKIQQ